MAERTRPLTQIAAEKKRNVWIVCWAQWQSSCLLAPSSVIFEFPLLVYLTSFFLQSLYCAAVRRLYCHRENIMKPLALHLKHTSRDKITRGVKGSMGSHSDVWHFTQIQNEKAVKHQQKQKATCNGRLGGKHTQRVDSTEKISQFFCIALRSRVPAESSCFLLCFLSHLTDSSSSEMETSGGWRRKRGNTLRVEHKKGRAHDERDGAKSP